MLFVATGRVEEFVTADIPSNSMFPMLLKHHIHKQVPRRVLMPGDYFGETERPTAWLQWPRSSFQSTQTTWKLLNGASTKFCSFFVDMLLLVQLASPARTIDFFFADQ
jgi:hypothetical protein